MLEPTGVHPHARRHHEERVLTTLRENGPLTRGEISTRIGLSRSRLSEITGGLLDRGAITTVPDPRRRVGRGRPAERLVLDPNAGQYIGIDFGHVRARVVVSNAAHELIASVVTDYAADATWDDRITRTLDLIDHTATSAAIHFEAVQAVSIGLPGPFSPRLPGSDSAPIHQARRTGADLVRANFADRFTAPVVLDNNTRLAGLGEAVWENPEPASDLLYVRISDGIGGSLVVAGHLITGASGFAGEFGHVSVDGHGEPCRCGKRGCLETIAATGAILSRLAERGVTIDSLAELAGFAAKGDPIVVGVLREAGEALGRVLGSLAVGLDPAEIVIGGDVVQHADLVFEQARDTIAYEMLPVSEASPLIRRATLGDEGGAIGAVVALFHTSPLLTNYPEVVRDADPTPGPTTSPDRTSPDRTSRPTRARGRAR